MSPKVPADIVEKIYAAAHRVAGLEAFHDQIARMGFEPVVPETLQQFAQSLQLAYDHFGELNRTFILKQ